MTPTELKNRIDALELERRRLSDLEQRLSETAKRFSILLEATDDGIWDWNVQSGKVFFDSRYYTLLGYEVGEFDPSYDSWRERVHPDDIKEVEPQVFQAVKERAPFSIEFRFREKSGGWHWLQSRAKMVECDKDGAPIRYAGFHTDIESRKRTEQALEKRLLALTRPVESETIEFEDLFDLSEIQRLQDLYAKAFGVAALITRPDGTPITQPSNFSTFCSEFIRNNPIGVRKCQHSDAEIGRHNPDGPNIQPCMSAGLCNAGVSITVGGTHVANWLIGQVRNESQKEEEILTYANELGEDEDAFRAAYYQVPVMPQEQFDMLADILFELANQLSTTAYQNVQQARFIAAHKRTEEALRQANLVVESSPVMLFRWRAAEGWPVILVSKNVTQLGYTQEALLSGALPFSTILHPDDLERIQQEIEIYCASGAERFQQEYRILTRDGQVRWVDDRTVVERNAEGTITHFQGILVDITERKTAEEALRNYEKIVSSSQDLMALVDRSYVHNALNASMLKAYKKPREAVIGHAMPAVIGASLFEECFKQQLDRALEGETVHYRDHIDFAGLGRRLFDITCFPMTEGVDNIKGVVLIARDITETQRLEEQLIQSQKIESIGTLAGGVAHEINNPINGIMNYAQLILDRLAEDDANREYAQEIVHETQRIAEIVRNLLTFARHDKQSHSAARFEDIVKEVLSLIQTVIRHDQIDMSVDVPAGLPKVRCRSQQIQQVLMNLMTNARDSLNERYPEYSQEKRLRVFSTLVEKDGRPYIRTTVEDTGIGIPERIRDRIFDPFFTTKPKDSGTGLGLSISYAIVKDHGGDLAVESEPGRYTRFKMDLPVSDEPSETKNRSRAASEPL